MKSQNNIQTIRRIHDLEQQLTHLTERLDHTNDFITSLKFLIECQKRVIRDYEKAYNIYGPGSPGALPETIGREEYFRLTKGFLFLPENMN